MVKITPTLVDAHCHLDLYPDMESVMRQSEMSGVATIAVTTTPRAWPRNRDLSHQFDLIEPALGLHPQLVGHLPADIDVWDSYLSQARVIGEVGLDAGPKFYKTLDMQKETFSHVLRSCAQAGGKVLTVHSVRAVKMVLDMIEEELAGSNCKIILHWFTGTVAEAQKAVELGCYFSINSAMFEKSRHMDMIQSIPIDRLLTETDGPFTLRKGLPSTPYDVGQTMSKLAEALNNKSESLSHTVMENYHHLFK